MADRSPNPSNLQWCTVGELCRRWGVSDDTVRREIAAGRLPHTRIRGQIRVHVDDAEAYEVRHARGRVKIRRRPPSAFPSVPDRLGDVSQYA